MNRFITPSRKKIPALGVWLAVVLGLGAASAHAASVYNIQSLKVEDVGSSVTCDPVNPSDPVSQSAGSNGCDYSTAVDPAPGTLSGGFQFTDQCTFNEYIRQRPYRVCDAAAPLVTVNGYLASLWSGDLNAGTILFDGAAQAPGLPAGSDPRSFTTGFALGAANNYPFNGAFYPGVGAQGVRGTYHFDTGVRDDSALTISQWNFTGTWVDGATTFTFPQTPDAPMRVNWVQPGVDALHKKVQLMWTHVITATEATGAGAPFANFRAAWVVEGTMTLDNDTSPPVVTATTPADGAVGVSPSLSSITVTFDEKMNPATVTTGAFTLTPAGVTVSAPTTADDISFTFPVSGVASETMYTLAFNAGPQDVAGVNLTLPANKSFTTADITAPTLLSTNPAANATDVAIGATVVLTFSEPMNAASVAGAFSLSGGATDTAVTGAMSNVGNVYTFTPSSALAYSTSYTARLSAAATDVAGNPVSASTRSFTTVADPTPPTITIAAAAKSGCSLSTQPVPLSRHGEWWVLAGFLTWLGGWRGRVSRK